MQIQKSIQEVKFIKSIGFAHIINRLKFGGLSVSHGGQQHVVGLICSPAKRDTVKKTYSEEHKEPLCISAKSARVNGHVRSDRKYRRDERTSSCANQNQSNTCIYRDP